MNNKRQIKNVREIRIEGDIAFIPLTQGFEAVVDTADLHKVSGFSWSALRGRTKTYAKSILPANEMGVRCSVLMHRLLIDCPSHLFVDHIDGDSLNNRSANLRIATVSENCRNRGAQANNNSGFKGVGWHKRDKKWRARITVGGVVKQLGQFDCPQLAHAAYCAANQIYHGEFGRVG